MRRLIMALKDAIDRAFKKKEERGWEKWPRLYIMVDLHDVIIEGNYTKYNDNRRYCNMAIECLKQWYSWHIEAEVDFNEFMKKLKESGKPVLMCMEKYAKKMRDQKYSCHRDILADLVINHPIEDSLMKFENRVDL